MCVSVCERERKKERAKERERTRAHLENLEAIGVVHGALLAVVGEARHA